MISLSISLLSLTLIYFILGMYKPHWVLFGMKNPSRIWVIVVTVFALMFALTLYGEGIKRKQEALTENSAEQAAKTEVSTPTIVAPTTVAPVISEPIVSTTTVPIISTE